MACHYVISENIMINLIEILQPIEHIVHSCMHEHTIQVVCIGFINIIICHFSKFFHMQEYQQQLGLATLNAVIFCSMAEQGICTCQGRNKLRNRNEAARAQTSANIWPVRQSEAVLKPNVVALTFGLNTIHRFIPSCWLVFIPTLS